MKRPWFLTLLCILFFASSSYAQDAINPKAVTVEGGAADVLTWPITSTLNDFTLEPGHLLTRYSKQGQWPGVDIGGALQEATLWVCLQVPSWHCTGAERLRPNQMDKPEVMDVANVIARDWLYAKDRWPSMSGHVLSPGEQIGVMVAAGSTRSDYNVKVKERTPIRLARFDGTTVALETASASESVLDTLKRVRAKYGTLTAAQAAAVLNEVAWDHKDEGVVLLGKAGGSNCPQPKTNTPISCDYLVDSATKKGADVLIGWDAAGTPTFSGFNDDLSSALADGSRTLVKPVDSGSSSGGTTKPPVTTTLTKADIDAAVAALEAHDDANTQKIQQQIDQVVNNAEKTGGSIWKWLGPLLAGLGTTAGILVH